MRKSRSPAPIAGGKATGCAKSRRAVKRLTSELGGHAPVIVCEDTDRPRCSSSPCSEVPQRPGQVCASPIPASWYSSATMRRATSPRPRAYAWAPGDDPPRKWAR
ncbi:MAG: aldehyde dehydrogenase family protein [Ideonella sp.]|nr:aldehyde dehydrogenase family protein [Ideonella sp.]